MTAYICNLILSAITVHESRNADWPALSSLQLPHHCRCSTTLSGSLPSPFPVWTTCRNTWTPPLGAETHSPPRVGTPLFYSWEPEPHTSHPTLCCKVNVKWSQKIILPENLMIVSALHKICFSVILWSLTLYSSPSLLCWCIQMHKTLILTFPVSSISPASFHVSSYPRFPSFRPFFLHAVIMHCVQIQLSNLHAKAAHQMSLWTCFSEELRWRTEMVRVEQIDEWKKSWTEGWWWGWVI